MTLSETQIDQLFAFTRQHFVEYYDLQSELVDHLANAIEFRWTENPTLSFDEALQAEFKKFGVFGFMNVVENRQAALTKKYNKLVWKHFVGFFRFPAIALFTGIFAIVFLLLESCGFRREMFVVSFMALTVGFFVKSLVNRQQNKKKQKSGKKWLFEEIIQHYGSVWFFVFIPFQFSSHLYTWTEHHFENPIIIGAYSFFLVAYAAILYILVWIIPSKANEYLRETYPEYDLVEA